MPDTIVSRPTPWRTVILVCGKCSRKLDGGFGDKAKEKLRTAMNDELRVQERRRSVRVIEAKCFGLCPKKAIVVLNASTPTRLLTVPKGTPTREILAALSDSGTGCEGNEVTSS